MDSRPSLPGNQEGNVPGVATPGTVLAGKYRVDSMLGAGGMGVVLAAWHLDLEQRVAIKLMLPEMALYAEAVARFMREARAAVRLRNEHVARVFDVGKLDTGQPYMVMEMLEGQDLAHVLRDRGPLPLEETVDLFLQACEAIGEAHSLGIVHRDLKPANLFLTQDAYGAPCVKVLDFGISKMSRPAGDSTNTSLTSTSALLGTPMYMSPEQMQRAKETDARADIWALGAVLYELLTGELAFAGDDIAQIVAAVIMGESPRVRAIRPELPEAVEVIVGRCLQRDLTQRYQRVADMALELAPFGSLKARVSLERLLGKAPIGSEGASIAVPLVQRREPEPAPAAQPADAPSTHVAWGTAQTSSKGTLPQPRRKSFAAVSGGIALVVVAVVVWVAFGRGRASSDPGRASATAVESLEPPSESPAPTTPPIAAPIESAPPPAASSAAVVAANSTGFKQPSRPGKPAPTSPATVPSPPPPVETVAAPPATPTQPPPTATAKAPPAKTLTDFGGRE